MPIFNEISQMNFPVIKKSMLCWHALFLYSVIYFLLTDEVVSTCNVIEDNNIVATLDRNVRTILLSDS